jgi:outer membrane biosynthesis protein TonB
MLLQQVYLRRVPRISRFSRCGPFRNPTASFTVSFVEKREERVAPAFSLLRGFDRKLQSHCLGHGNQGGKPSVSANRSSIPDGNLKYPVQLSIVRIDSMAVRCAKCGYDNNPDYRFCGVCGAAMWPPPPGAPEPEKESAPFTISGPSFLGLGENPSSKGAYLLEEEPPARRWRMYLALVLLVVSAGILGWHWWRDGFPWKASPTGPAAAPMSSVSPPAVSAPAAEQPVATVPTEQQPAAASEKTEVAQSPASEPQAESLTAAVPKTEAPDSVQPSDDSKSAEPAPQQKAAAAQPEETAEASPPPVSKAPKAKAQPAAAALPYDEKLVADGEKYLYGNGVPQNCDRAQMRLQTAASLSNPKAYSMLGAMYATGHCVTRDLPTAYRWFAKALHREPGNARVERDVELVWKQMTPGERQIAVRSGQ